MAWQLRSKKTIKIAAISLFVIILGGLLIAFTYASNQAANSNTTSTITPDFEALLPQGKTIDKLGGWQKLTPPNSAPYFVFVDTIDSVGVSVSQQTLPETFKSDTAQGIRELAKSYSATEELTANEVKVYLGTSAKGPQSVIFTKNNLLVLIKSQANIENDAWIAYIKTLESKNTPRF